MIVKNRTTGKEYEINRTEFQKLVDKKQHRLFIVIDNTDATTNKIVIPKEITEYQANPERLRIKKEPVIATKTKESK